MARWSDPSLAEGASLNRFYVWNSDSDPFSREELERNFDRIDAIIGRPDGDAIFWPPTQGVGGGIWREIQLLLNDRSDIGDVKMWWHPFTGTETLAQIEALIPSEWAIMDGRKIPAGEHDFEGLEDQDVYLPDARHMVPMGASLTRDGAVNAPGTPGVTVDSASAAAQSSSPRYAPGIATTTAGGANEGDGIVRGVTNGITGRGALPNVAVPVPDHHHDMQHVHLIGYPGMNQDHTFTNTSLQNPEQGRATIWAPSAGVGASGWIIEGYDWVKNAKGTYEKRLVDRQADSITVVTGGPQHSHSGTISAPIIYSTSSQPRAVLSTDGYGNRRTDSGGKPAGVDIERQMTSRQILSASYAAIPGTSSAVYPSSGSAGAGAAGGSALIGTVKSDGAAVSHLDVRQKSLPLLFLMKVKRTQLTS